MNHYKTPPEGSDPRLWEIARKRASFKSHLASYIIINVFLWALWFFRHGAYVSHGNAGWPWPLWTTLGWGIGIAFHYYDAYVNPRANSVQREYDKLKNEEDRARQ